MILLLLITIGCQTEKIIIPDYTLPIKPVRQEILYNDYMTVKDYVTIIIYYEYLLRSWEAWCEAVKKIVLTDSED